MINTFRSINPITEEQAYTPEFTYDTETQKLHLDQPIVDPLDVTNKQYVDNAIAAAIAGLPKTGE